MRKRIVIIGNSHTAAVSEAIANTPAKTFDIEVHRLGKKTDGSGLSQPEARELLSRDVERTVLFSMLEGEEHFIVGLLRPQEPYDFHLPNSNLGVIPGHRIIPSKMMAALLREKLSIRIRKLAMFRSAFAGPIFQIESPPPKGNRQFLVETSEIISRIFNVREFEINDNSVRLKLWILQRSILRKVCRKLNIGFLPAPSGAMDSSCFMKEKYYANDPVHANSEYGALILEQVESVANKAA